MKLRQTITGINTIAVLFLSTVTSSALAPKSTETVTNRDIRVQADVSPDNRNAARQASALRFIATGDMVAARCEAEYKYDLKTSYKIADPLELDRLYLLCDNSWGAVAYLLALESTTGKSARNILIIRDLQRGWYGAARKLRAIFANGDPSYKLSIHIDRQQNIWKKLLATSGYTGTI